MLRNLLRLCFSLEQRVDRERYALVGFGLVSAKYLVDTAAIRWATGAWWTPIDYFSPRTLAQWQELVESSGVAVAALVVWTLPFLWIGASMTARRAIDAGFPGATGLLFFVPVLNYVWMLALCLFPTAPGGSAPEAAQARRGSAGVVRAAVPATLLGLAVALVSIFGSGSYGPVLFVGTPFAMGFTAAYRSRRLGMRGSIVGLAAGQLSIFLAGGLFLLSALEGAVCLAMAAPLAAVLAALGSVIGSSVAAPHAVGAAQSLLIFASLPLLLGAESLRGGPPLREVVSVVEIDAPPERVWPNVVGFSELPPASRWLFRAGIAHPLHARIEGHGVGAVRYCEFSTGPFVEPITAWDEPRRLSFDVARQPEPMHEWSPYQVVHAPHLLDGLRSHRGEFRLTPLPGGRTRLEGSTWYTLELGPAPYWSLWSDALIGEIHARVLEHVKRLSETGGERSWNPRGEIVRGRGD